MKRAWPLFCMHLFLFALSAGAQTVWREIPLGDTEEHFYYLQMRSTGGTEIFQRVSLIKKHKETFEEAARMILDTPSFVDKKQPEASEYLREQSVTYFHPLNWHSHFVIEDSVVYESQDYRATLLSADSLQLQVPSASGAEAIGLYSPPQSRGRPEDRLYLLIQVSDNERVLSVSERIIVLPYLPVMRAFAEGERRKQQKGMPEKND